MAIFQYRAEPTSNFCRQRDVELDCLGDPQRDAYAEVGLGHARVTELADPRLLGGALRAARQGALPGVPKGDVRQKPGTFVVSSDGRVLLAHYNRDQSDNPPMEPILEAVRAAGRGSNGP